MRWTALLYGGVGAAALTAAVLIPWLVHSQGSERLPGWRGLVNPGALSESHQFLAAQCEACHTPHVGVEAKRCLTCHTANAFTAKGSTRFHAQARTCQGCHVEHAGAARPIRMDHTALLVPGLWTEAPTLPPKSTVAALECAGCHAVKDPHQGLMGQRCSSCHGVEAWSVPGFQHPPTTSPDCAECHRAPPSHRMMHFEMVSQRVAGRKARLEQCGACHTTDDWNNIQGVGRFDHH